MDSGLSRNRSQYFAKAQLKWVIETVDNIRELTENQIIHSLSHHGMDTGYYSK